MTATLRPILVHFPEAEQREDYRDRILGEWPANALAMLAHARDYIRGVASRDYGRAAEPVIISLAGEAPRTWQGMWARMRREIPIGPGEFVCAWVYPWSLGTIGDRGGELQGLGRPIGSAWYAPASRGLALVMGRNLLAYFDDGRHGKGPAWLPLHESLHALGLPHGNPDPRDPDCKQRTPTCYSPAQFAGERAEYLPPGMYAEEIQHLQQRTPLAEVEQMPSYIVRAATPAPRPETRRARPGGFADIDQIHVHATRGPTSMDRQVSATESWFASYANQLNSAGQYRGWGGSADFVLGPDFRKSGQIVIVEFGDWLATWARFAAGYGDNWRTQYAAAQRAVSIEVAQPMGKDANGNYLNSPSANFEHFTDETIDALVWLIGHINERIVAVGGTEIPAVHLDGWDQLRAMPIPRGHIGHEELANGLRLHKSDPGHLFPWDEYMRRIAIGDAPSPPHEHDDALAALNQAQDDLIRANIAIGLADANIELAKGNIEGS